MTTTEEARLTVADVRGANGLIETKLRRETGRVVSVYDGAAAAMVTYGMDSRGEYREDGNPYSTVCEDHGHVVSHATLALARAHATNPLGWCEPCMDEHRGGS